MIYSTQEGLYKPALCIQDDSPACSLLSITLPDGKRKLSQVILHMKSFVSEADIYGMGK